MSFTEKLNAAYDSYDEDRIHAVLDEMTCRDHLIYAIEVDEDAFSLANEMMFQDPYIDLGDNADGPGPLSLALIHRKYKIAAMMLDQTKQEWESDDDKWFLRALIRWRSGY